MLKISKSLGTKLQEFLDFGDDKDEGEEIGPPPSKTIEQLQKELEEAVAGYEKALMMHEMLELKAKNSS